MNLFLHIGTEKTGTTSLQKFMAANRPILEEEGFFYPQSPGADNHIALAAMARRSRTELWDQLGIGDRERWEEFREEFQRRFSAELAMKEGKNVVMSGEHCSSRLRTDEDVHRLFEFLNQFFTRITVIVYLRRQDDFLTSTYSTDIKNGSTAPLAIPDEDTIAFRYNYWELLSRWSRVFGRENMVARRYGKMFLTNENLVDDFLGVIGLVPRRPWEQPVALNESLDAECVEFLRLMNAHLRPSEQRRGIVAVLQALSRGPLIDLPPAEQTAFMSALDDSNRRVALEYFQGELAPSGDPLFGDRQGGRARMPSPQLTVDRAVALAAEVYAQLRLGGAKVHRPRKKAG